MKCRRPGGQAEYVRDRSGALVVGLSCNGHDGRFYATHSRPRKWFGRDFDLAVIRFREWEAQTLGKRREVILDRRALTREEAALLSAQEDRPVDTIERVETVRDDLWWQQVRAAILEDLPLAAQKLGLPVDRLHMYKPIEPSPTLQSIGQEYQTYAKTVSPYWKKRVKQFWSDFVKRVEVATVRDLNQQIITRYGDWVLDNATSPSWAMHRFAAVKTVLNFAKSRGIAVTELQTVIDYCAVLVPPKKAKVDPHPISVKDFQALYNASDDLWQALLVTSLNFCMYLSEVVELKWDQIDRERKTFVGSRRKTGIVRVATVWDRTIEALDKLPRKGPFIFVNREGNHYEASTLRESFRDVRTKAGLGAEVKFNWIRDGSYSAAVEGCPAEAGKVIATNAMLLAGHRTGMPDHYVQRNPRMVKSACDAVEQYYFPPGQQQPQA